ncbi:hypothetical protein F5884DRAFT_65542, partial [Xylogone sp. PMI_703]
MLGILDESIETLPRGSSTRAGRQKGDPRRHDSGIAYELPPLSRNSDIFRDLAEKAMSLGFKDVISKLDGQPLRVATMCSGTESPILALMQVADNIKKKYGIAFNFEHVFSAEIVAWKQAYIEINFRPPIIFRDIVELTEDNPDPSKPRLATTAYGAKVPVPGDINLLVAGFSCVDFSLLNNARKEIKEGGESGDTLFAIIAYAREYRPDIIILENICGAPWSDAKIDDEKKKNGSRGIDYLMAQAGYSTKSVVIDTKDYYLPQTRNRGYMVCVNRERFQSDNDEVEIKLNAWAKLMKRFERPASVPVDAILLSEDHHEYGPDNGYEERDWTKCKDGHSRYRADNGLGTKHELTKWNGGGSCVLPDYMSKKIRGMVSRVLDTIEIAHLRNIKRGFDDRYYSRFLELSQNVHRCEDLARNGIIGCLTPNGIPYSTVEGRRIMGREALLLQGLPVEQLDLFRLTQAQLRDLAGNAMTSTVVGAAMLAGLIQFKQLLRSDSTATAPSILPNSALTILRPINGRTSLVPKVLSVASYTPVSMAKIITEAEKTIRLCFCEGSFGVTKSTILKCKICNQTACEDCGKNPKHDYIKTNTENRKDPIEFERLLKQSIPKMLTFTKLDREKVHEQFYNLLNSTGVETWKLIIDQIYKAMSSMVYLRSIRRFESWEAIFDSQYAKITLTISPYCVEWLAYAQVSAEIPGNSPDRLYLAKHPFARMRPTGDDICQGHWEFWLPQMQHIRATVSVPSDAVLIPSFQATRGLEDYENSLVWDAYSVSLEDPADVQYLEHDIQGIYQSSQVCGQAFNSLHANRSKNLKRPIFLYLDHELRTGDPSSHSYVFTLDKTRLRYGQYRPQTVARLPCDWQPPMIYELPINETEETFRPKRSVEIQADGRWMSFESFGFEFPTDKIVEFGHISDCSSSNFQNPSCYGRDIVLTAHSNIDMEIDSVWSQDEWIIIDSSKELDFEANFGWMLTQGLFVEGHSQGNAAWQGRTSITNVQICQTCAPTPPPLLWKSAIKGTAEGVTMVENPEKAAQYEHQQKSRPPPLTTFLRINSNGIVDIQVEVNKTVLVHRALSQLGEGKHLEEAEVSWRLVTDDRTSKPPSCRPFFLKDNRMDNYKLLQKPNFANQFCLRDDQEASVAWMIEQERHPAVFIEEEVVEMRARHIGYRAEGRAARKCLVRGGIQGHEVGFGKTITTLALLDCQREIDIATTLESPEDMISVKATIIFVPPHLYEQWDYEVTKFLPADSRGEVLIIKNTQSLRALTIADIQEANIIIASWNILESKAYMDNLAEFAGMLEPLQSTSTRAKYAWYREALKAIAQNTILLKSDPANFRTILEHQYNISLEMADSIEVPVSSKRRRGAAYQAWRLKQIQDSETSSPRKNSRTNYQWRSSRDNSGSENEWASWRAPVFEIFKFARVVIDEYTYLTPHVSMVLENFKAHCRWALSGTPSLGSFTDIKNMAKLVGIRLGVDDFASMNTDVAKGPARELTRSELFRTFQTLPSPAWQERRHQYAQRFLDQFVRQNAVHSTTFDSSNHLQIGSLQPAERALYQEFMQKLADTGFEMQEVRKDDILERQIRGDLVTDCEDGKEALILRATFFSFTNLTSTALDTRQQLEMMIDIRGNDYMELSRSFEDHLKHAEWLNRDPESSCKIYDDLKARLRRSAPEDKEVTEEIKLAIQSAEENYSVDDWRKFYRTGTTNVEETQLPLLPKGKSHKVGLGHLTQKVVNLRQECAILNDLQEKLVIQKRALRHFESILHIYDLSVERSMKESNVDTMCDKCHRAIPSLSETVILTTCGHIVCNIHCDVSSQAECPVEGCTAVLEEHTQYSGTEMDANTFTSFSAYGPKVDGVIELLNRIPDDDKILLFLQFRTLTHRVKEVLNAADIQFSDLTIAKTTDRSKILTQFQKGKTSSRVLIMNVGDTSAAGSNLTCANHIIFLSPYYTNGSNAKEEYNHAMTQAIGRARRYGQKKHVHIYHFLVAHTIDIDLFQERQNKNIMIGPRSPKDTAPYHDFDDSAILIERVKGDLGGLCSPVAHLLK